MEKIFLEQIIETIKNLDRENYLEYSDKIYEAYKKGDVEKAVKTAYITIQNMSGNILKSSNLKTVSGTAKIMNYINLYNEVSSFIELYRPVIENKKTDNLGFYGCPIQKEFNKPIKNR